MAPVRHNGLTAADIRSLLLSNRWQLRPRHQVSRLRSRHSGLSALDDLAHGIFIGPQYGPA